MRKYKFILMLSVIVALFFVISWFVYDGIDIFFNLIFSPEKEKVEEVIKEKAPTIFRRTSYKTQNADVDVTHRDDTTAPDTRKIKISRISQRENAFERFVNKIFPQQLDYILNPYSFFLLLVLSVLPVI